MSTIPFQGLHNARLDQAAGLRDERDKLRDENERLRASLRDITEIIQRNSEAMKDMYRDIEAFFDEETGQPEAAAKKTNEGAGG
jgi:hypothetical protein